MNRLFLAIPVTIFDYKSLQDDFEGLIKGKWTIPQNLHLTLNFFGNTFEKEFLIKTLSTLKLKAEPSDLKGLTLLTQNKILYAQTENGSLSTLHTQIRAALMLPSGQEFIPHVTLMRIKKINHPTLFEQKLRTYDKKIIGTIHPKVQLIQSHVTSTGAQYTLLKEFGS
jgi:2'-5' RNA ligase